MAEPWIAAIIVPIVFFFILIILSKSCYIVNQSEAIVIERFGRFHRILDSGLSFIVPFVDAPRKFPWQYTSLSQTGAIVDTTRSDYRFDLREAVFHFAPMEVYTKDTLLLEINSLMYYRISDVRKAVYEVDDLQNALTAAAQTQLKEVFGLMSFHEALECQEFINDHLVREFSSMFEKWGVEVNRMEMLGLNPGRTEYQTINAMKLQMIAERRRRGEFIKSEGVKAAANIIAEGTKKVALTLGVANQESTRKISEGRAQETVMLAHAEKASLDAISAATKREGTSLSQFWMTSKYLRFFEQLRVGHNGVFFLPYEPFSFAGVMHRGVSRAFGHNPDPAAKLLKYVPPGTAATAVTTGTAGSGAHAAAASTSSSSSSTMAKSTELTGLD